MPFYKWDQLESDSITPKYSSAYGPNIRGEKIEVGFDLIFLFTTEAQRTQRILFLICGEIPAY